MQAAEARCRHLGSLVDRRLDQRLHDGVGADIGGRGSAVRPIPVPIPVDAYLVVPGRRTLQPGQELDWQFLIAVDVQKRVSLHGVAPCTAACGTLPGTVPKRAPRNRAGPRGWTFTCWSMCHSTSYTFRECSREGAT